MGRDADCPSVPHTSDLSVKFLLYLGHGFSWVAQVNNDKVKAPEPSCYCSWFMIQLNQGSGEETLLSLQLLSVGGR